MGVSELVVLTRRRRVGRCDATQTHSRGPLASPAIFGANAIGTARILGDMSLNMYTEGGDKRKGAPPIAPLERGAVAQATEGWMRRVFGLRTAEQVRAP